MQIRTLTLAALAAAAVTVAPAAGAQAKPAPSSAHAAPAAAAAKADFTGRWEMNAAKSDFGMAAAQAPTSIVMTLARAGDKLTVAQQVAAGGQTMNVTNDYTLDGKPVTATAGDGQPATSTARTSGDSIFVDASMERQGMQITRTSVWTVAPDGKSLTIVQEAATPMGAFKMSIVFDRK